MRRLYESNLARVLLAIGGTRVQTGFVTDAAARKVLQRGRRVDVRNPWAVPGLTDADLAGMRYAARSGVDLMQGFALHPIGQWVPHTWATVDGVVLDDQPRSGYFGYVLNAVETDRFMEDHLRVGSPVKPELVAILRTRRSLGTA